MSLASLADRLDIEHPHSVPGLTTEHQPAGEDVRVAIVYDDASAFMLMTRLLERDGFSRVTGMGDGERALAHMIEHPPDVMVLDVHMPRVDGFRVLREMHNTEARVNTVTGIL